MSGKYVSFTSPHKPTEIGPAIKKPYGNQEATLEEELHRGIKHKGVLFDALNTAESTDEKGIWRGAITQHREQMREIINNRSQARGNRDGRVEGKVRDMLQRNKKRPYWMRS
jgi:hypothetical protein